MLAAICILSVSTMLSSFSNHTNTGFKMPWKSAGLTERQAAAHLISRFTFGNKPGLTDEVVNTGLEKWFQQQLDGSQDDAALKERLKNYDALSMSNQQILQTFPRAAKILKQAVDDGIITKDDISKNDKAAYRLQLNDYMKQKGFRREPELYMQFANQKILYAAYSNNQLKQVLTEFWFNHFNVSATKNDCAQFIPVYERDVIRANVNGKFADLLLATAHAPAMLFYLDNFNSSGVNEEMEATQARMKKRLEKKIQAAEANMDEDKAKLMEKLKQRKINQGLNENYAREIMELHTLGVDGGYTQADVTEAARVLTGWTVYPMEGLGYAGFARKLIEKYGEDNLLKKGFVHKGDFLFAMNRHDSKEKKVMGRKFPAGGGYEEGVALIHMLAQHASTAKFISKKLAIRFVSDNPSQALIDKMAQSFLKTDGDIRQVLITMVASPEFWAKEAVREKTKSPFELAISAVRSLDAQIEQPFMLYQWIAQMGQQLYYYQAPTGFPDKGQYWINTGSLLNRMKFGLAFAAQKIPGVQFNLAALNNNHEPESAVHALELYSKIIMPERNVQETIQRLEPMIHDPSIQKKIDDAARKSPASETPINASDEMMEQNSNDEVMEQYCSKNMTEEKLARQMLRKNNSKEVMIPTAEGYNSMLAQVVGIILGSPEFQRR